MSSSNCSLLVVGSLAFDDIDGPEGLKKDLLGGSASFFAEAAAYFTSHNAIVAVVGDDFPSAVLEGWYERGIDVSGVKREKGKTFRWTGKYADDLATRETLATELGVFADFVPTLSEQHRKAEMVFLGNIHPTLQSQVLDQVEAPKLVALDTMNFWIDGELEALKKTLSRVSTLIINDEEARQLSGKLSLVEAAKSIRAMGPHSLVIKRGDAGALLFDEDGVFSAPAMPLSLVRDPTGAGDTFAGGFMGYLAYAGSTSPSDIRNAIIFGSVMASFTVEKFSTEGLHGLEKHDIQRRFDAFHDLARFDRVEL